MSGCLQLFTWRQIKEQMRDLENWKECTDDKANCFNGNLCLSQKAKETPTLYRFTKAIGSMDGASCFTLCARCHGAKPSGLETIMKNFSEKNMWTDNKLLANK